VTPDRLKLEPRDAPGLSSIAHLWCEKDLPWQLTDFNRNHWWHHGSSIIRHVVFIWG
jgi:hypothetical protein